MGNLHKPRKNTGKNSTFSKAIKDSSKTPLIVGDRPIKPITLEEKFLCGQTNSVKINFPSAVINFERKCNLPEADYWPCSFRYATGGIEYCMYSDGWYNSWKKDKGKK